MTKPHRSPLPSSRGLPVPIAAETFSLTQEQRHRASRVTASAAHDAIDCALLLGALGLTPADGLTAPSSAQPD